MHKVEYLDKTINVPADWRDISVGTYEGFLNMPRKSTAEKAAAVEFLIGVEPGTFAPLPTDVFTQAATLLNFAFKGELGEPSASIDVKGVKYCVNVENKLTLSEWVDLEQAQAERVNFSEVLAIVCRPAGEAYDPDKTDERAEIFKSLSMADIRPVLAFFLRCANVLEANTRQFSQLEGARELLQTNLSSLRVNGAGIKLFTIWRRVQFWILTGFYLFRLRRSIRF